MEGQWDAVQSAPDGILVSEHIRRTRGRDAHCAALRKKHEPVNRASIETPHVQGSQQGQAVGNDSAPRFISSIDVSKRQLGCVNGNAATKRRWRGVGRRLGQHRLPGEFPRCWPALSRSLSICSTAIHCLSAYASSCSLLLPLLEVSSLPVRELAQKPPLPRGLTVIRCSSVCPASALRMATTCCEDKLHSFRRFWLCRLCRL